MATDKRTKEDLLKDCERLVKELERSTEIREALVQDIASFIIINKPHLITTSLEALIAPDYTEFQNTDPVDRFLLLLKERAV